MNQFKKELDPKLSNKEPSYSTNNFILLPQQVRRLLQLFGLHGPLLPSPRWLHR